MRVPYPLTLYFDVRNLLAGAGGLAASPIYAPATVPIEGRRFSLGLDVRF